MEKNLIIDQPDFRRYATEKATRDDGSVQYFCTCEEFIGGKWEGFVIFSTLANYLKEQEIIKSRNNTNE